MWLLLVCVALLALGYFLYSRLVQRALIPFHDPTPAIRLNDGIDYVPMSKWKDQLIELLNIAGTGPIFGALMGAKWGPIVLLWIVGGSILGGAVHDYFSGMMSTRHNGQSASWLVQHYMGGWLRYPILIFLVFLLIMVSATMARSAGDLLTALTDLPLTFWIGIILIYFMASAVLPINKFIGKIYPIFGVLLIAMAVTVIAGLAFGGYEFPTMTLENLHPTGTEYFPDMFITVACGAISGFHATQAPVIARCLQKEKHGRMVFYGAMIIESVIALMWAIAGLAFYDSTAALANALAEGGASGVVYEIATGVAGPLGAILTVVGVMICPITTGDTALRSARLMLQDDRGYDAGDFSRMLLITGFLTVFIVLLCYLDFSILWNYFSWMNQTLACIMLWTATVFLLINNRKYSILAAAPALFMTLIVTSFILHSSLGLHLDYNISVIIGAVITVIAAILYLRYYFVGSFRKKAEEETSP